MAWTRLNVAECPVCGHRREKVPYARSWAGRRLHCAEVVCPSCGLKGPRASAVLEYQACAEAARLWAEQAARYAPAGGRP